MSKERLYRYTLALRIRTDLTTAAVMNLFDSWHCHVDVCRTAGDGWLVLIVSSDDKPLVLSCAQNLHSRGFSRPQMWSTPLDGWVEF
jgi:hypothetical protein